MSRPTKCRRVSFIPGIQFFKPSGTSLDTLTEVLLSLDELEAIRLKDLVGLEQEEGALLMNISRPTFQRILTAAHEKTADALLNGKILKIEGGYYELTSQHFRCRHGHEWKTESTGESPEVCPRCYTPDIVPVLPRYERHSGSKPRRIAEEK